MPSNRLALAVFIGRQPNVVGAYFFDGFFQFSDYFFLFRVDFVSRFEAVLDINWRRAVFGFFGDSANMPHA